MRKTCSVIVKKVRKKTEEKNREGAAHAQDILNIERTIQIEQNKFYRLYILKEEAIVSLNNEELTQLLANVITKNKILVVQIRVELTKDKTKIAILKYISDTPEYFATLQNLSNKGYHTSNVVEANHMHLCEVITHNCQTGRVEVVDLIFKHLNQNDSNYCYYKNRFLTNAINHEKSEVLKLLLQNLQIRSVQEYNDLLPAFNECANKEIILMQCQLYQQIKRNINLETERGVQVLQQLQKKSAPLLNKVLDIYCGKFLVLYAANRTKAGLNSNFSLLPREIVNHINDMGVRLAIG